MVDFVDEFREVIGDRKDKKLLSDRGITRHWSGQ
jgi:hypothetical protein